MKPCKYILTLFVLIFAFTLNTSAAEASAPAAISSGKCGPDAYYELTGTGEELTLTISGTGSMYNYVVSEIYGEDGEIWYEPDDFKPPWFSNRDKIKTVILCDGITSTTTLDAFGFTARDLYIAPSVKQITLKSQNYHIENIESWLNLTRYPMPMSYEAWISTSETEGEWLIGKSTQRDSINIYLNGNLLTDLVIPEGTVRIPAFAFRGCASIKNVTLPAGLTRIEEDAFANCSGIEQIHLPEGLKSIGISAFMNCEKLEQIEIPDTVEEIGAGAFCNCSSLDEIRIPDRVDTICHGTFYGCSSIKHFELKKSISRIMENAFSDTVVFYEGNAEEWSNAASEINSEVLCDADNELPYACVKYTFNPILNLEPAEYYVRFNSDFENLIFAEEISLPGTFTLKKGKSAYLDAQIFPANVTFALCRYESGDPQIVSVEPFTGKLHANEFGSAVITVKSLDGTNLSASCEVNVTGEVKLESLSLDKKEAEIAAGNRLTLKPIYTPTNASIKEVTWESSDPKIAAVDGSGNVYAYRMGRVTITATSKQGGKTASCAVRVLFSDVTNKNLAAYNGIYWGADRGYVNGYGSYFDIDGKCTRAQFFLFLWRIAGKPAANTATLKFKDSADIEKLAADYKRAILWAVENGVVMGYTSPGPNQGKFKPNDPCTRGQIMTFLWRYKGQKAAKSGAKTFPDVPKTHKYYKAIMWASSYGITTGYADGKFRPDQPCTRGECVTFLYRLFK